MPITIGTLQHTDMEQVLALREALARYLGTLNPGRLSEPRKELAAWYGRILSEAINGKSGIVFVAKNGDTVVGYVFGKIQEASPEDALEFVPEPTAEIVDLFVMQEHRGKGIGNKLLRAAEEYFRGQGCVSIIINSLAANTALAMYGKSGYSPRDVTLIKRL